MTEMQRRYVCYDVTTEFNRIQLYATSAAEALALAKELYPGVHICSTIQSPEWIDD